MPSHDPAPARTSRIAFIGYGEVGTIFCAALARVAAPVAAFDLKIADPGWSAAARKRGEAHGVLVAASLGEALREATVVFSAVTAAETLAAAREAAAVIPPRALFVDLTSASPRTKTACAELVNAAGGRYVEAAVMSSVPPYGLQVSMLLGGPHAAEARPLLAAWEFEAKVGAPSYGVVSAIKLCRSVVIKGMEALAIESLAAARKYGVEEQVLASLVETFPGMDFPRQAAYFWKRVYQHGKRRAEEMREAAMAVTDAGLEPRMASATAEVQAWIASLRADGTFDGLDAESPWRAMADRIAATKA